jgi:hypothetical protein
MRARWRVVVLVVLLAVAGTASANVAAPVYPSDPGYGRAKFAAGAAPAVTLAAVVLAAGFFFRARSPGVRAAAFVFGVLAVLWWGFIRAASPPTRFPAEPGLGGLVSFGRQPGSPRGGPRPRRSSSPGSSRWPDCVRGCWRCAG